LIFIPQTRDGSHCDFGLSYDFAIFIFLFQMHDNPFTMLAAATLEQCINTRCCPTMILDGTVTDPVTWWDTDYMVNGCRQALGHFGETISDYNSHDAFGP
jgi:hypothetical protein